MEQNKEQILQQLVGLSRSIGVPAKDLVILGDGNTSATISEESFFVKASGSMLDGIGPDGFTEVRFEPVLDILKRDTISDTELKAEFANARVDAAAKHPSIETVFHAIALTHCGAKFVAHTHPISINSIMCSVDARKALSGHMFSESALYLGPEAVIIDYADPGLPIARALISEIDKYQQKWGQQPRVFYLLNHGMVALGQSAKEAENITAMAVKSARILLGTYQMGGPRFISEEDVRRIVTRPDEEFRRKMANK